MERVHWSSTGVRKGTVLQITGMLCRLSFSNRQIQLAASNFGDQRIVPSLQTVARGVIKASDAQTLVDRKESETIRVTHLDSDVISQRRLRVDVWMCRIDGSSQAPHHFDWVSTDTIAVAATVATCTALVVYSRCCNHSCHRRLVADILLNETEIHRKDCLVLSESAAHYVP